MYISFTYITVDELFRDGGVNGGQVRYQDFIENISQPVPDYQITVSIVPQILAPVSLQQLGKM